MTRKEQRDPSIAGKSAAGGFPEEDFFCKYNKPLCRPATFVDFINAAQNLLLVFVLNADRLPPEQERVLDAMQAEIIRWEDSWR